VVGDVVVMPAGSPRRVVEQLSEWGFAVLTVDVSELQKGGGSIRCMTLPLDTVLDTARLSSAGNVTDSDVTDSDVTDSDVTDSDDDPVPV